MNDLERVLSKLARLLKEADEPPPQPGPRPADRATGMTTNGAPAAPRPGGADRPGH